MMTRFRNSRHHENLILLLVFYLIEVTSGQSSDVPTPVGKCDAGRMTVTIPNNYLPFKGLIHVRGFRNNPNCFSNSTSSFAAPSLNLNLLSEPNDPDFCGIINLKDGREKAVSIAVRAHSSLELQDDKYFLLTCSNLRLPSKSNSQRTSKSLFRESESEGLVIYGLEKGHATRNVAVLGKAYYFGPKESNHLIGSCIAFGSTPESEFGSSNVVQLLDSRGCPSDNTIIEVSSSKNSGDGDDDVEIDSNNILKYQIKSMFRFPNKDFHGNEITPRNDGSFVGRTPRRKGHPEDDAWIDNQVTIQCSSVSCGGSSCPTPCTKEAGYLLTESPAASTLVTTSVNVLNPGLECDHEFQHQLTRDWLMALLICVCILLLVMFCINMFLCSSMACSCTKKEIIETSSSIDGRYPGHHRSHSRLGAPVTTYDYDPYKSMNGSQSHTNLTTMGDHQPFYATLQRKPAAIESRSSALGYGHNNNNTQVMEAATGTVDRRSTKFY